MSGSRHLAIEGLAMRLAFPVTFVVLMLAVAADARADGKTVDQVLAEHGIKTVGGLLVLDEDSQLATGIRDADTFSRRIREDAAKLKTLQGQVTIVKNTLTTYKNEKKALTAELNLIIDADAYNVALVARNILTNQIMAGEEKLRELEKARDEAASAQQGTLQAFADHVKALREQSESMRKKYASLLEDPDVSTALLVLNRDAEKPVSLAESPGFVASCNAIERLQKTIDTLNK